MHGANYGDVSIQMMFKCGICNKTKMGKYNLLKYVALDENNLPCDYSMKMCKPCSVALAGSGKIDKTQFDKNQKEKGSDFGDGDSSDYPMDLRR
jgi:hypothetical protein